MPSWLNWLGYAVGLIGSVIAIVQFVSWLRARKHRQADERIREIVSQQLNAEDVRLDAERYEALRQELRTQIEREIPKVARHRYLENRRDRLVESITREFEEYRSIESELGDSGPESMLDRRIVDVIQEALVPERRLRQRRERFLLALLGVLLLFNLLPVGSLPLFSWDVLLRPKAHTQTEMVFALLFVAAVAFTTALLSRSIFSRGAGSARRRTNSAHPTMWIVRAYLFAGGLGGAAFGAVAMWNSAHAAYDYASEYDYVNGRTIYDYTSWTSLVVTILLSCIVGILLATAVRVIGRRGRRPRRGAEVSG